MLGHVGEYPADESQQYFSLPQFLHVSALSFGSDLDAQQFISKWTVKMLSRSFVGLLPCRTPQAPGSKW